MPRRRTGNVSHAWIQGLLILAALLCLARAAMGNDEKDPYYLTVFRAEARVVAPVEAARCGTVELDLEVVCSEDGDCVFPYEVLRTEGDARRTVAAGELYRNADAEIVGTATWRLEPGDAGETWMGEVRVDAYSKDEEGNVVRLETFRPLAIPVPEDACIKDKDTKDEDGS